eukprot:ANDGO_06742.mRNA.1 hypothetical protein GUITHDRAFT_149716
MPPKKAGKDKKKGGDDDEMSPEEKIQRYERRIEALERFLAMRSEQTFKSKSEQLELSTRVRELHEDFSKEQDDRFAITSDMTRQYKAMQEELITRINVLENTIANLRDELELSRIALEQQKKEKDHLVGMKDREIAEQKQKMEDMAIEFGEMLKETLEKMSQRIDTSGQQFNADAAQAFVKDKIRELSSSHPAAAASSPS